MSFVLSLDFGANFGGLHTLANWIVSAIKSNYFSRTDLSKNTSIDLKQHVFHKVVVLIAFQSKRAKWTQANHLGTKLSQSSDDSEGGKKVKKCETSCDNIQVKGDKRG